eukprot:CAMPEP_0206294970 /NCGR_PEP_ID=MMETSP0106_2-20121207/4928_1 /ASSEMBLY_ACC=CAM_ASM_000206 /TAXON_ID=81532 /ORGANISM="Acanthoeca-like sp., Strain 10tr" /LENGTH=266 /DNA_ID=CAMNT_0053725615 /DNA_START=99 /DNA_END=896 /DNA_ORIENTATION=-
MPWITLGRLWRRRQTPAGGAEAQAIAIGVGMGADKAGRADRVPRTKRPLSNAGRGQGRGQCGPKEMPWIWTAPGPTSGHGCAESWHPGSAGIPHNPSLSDSHLVAPPCHFRHPGRAPSGCPTSHHQRHPFDPLPAEHIYECIEFDDEDDEVDECFNATLEPLPEEDEIEVFEPPRTRRRSLPNFSTYGGSVASPPPNAPPTPPLSPRKRLSSAGAPDAPPGRPFNHDGNEELRSGRWQRLERPESTVELSTISGDTGEAEKWKPIQ